MAPGPDDPPLISPDGRYGLAVSLRERRNNEWLEYCYLFDCRSNHSLFTLEPEHFAELEWTGEAQFTLVICDGSGSSVSVQGDANTRRFRFADGSFHGPLKDLALSVTRWFEKHGPAPLAEISSPGPPPSARSGARLARLAIILTVVIVFYAVLLGFAGLI